jgi:hypothetical protein
MLAPRRTETESLARMMASTLILIGARDGHYHRLGTGLRTGQRAVGHAARRPRRAINAPQFETAITDFLDGTTVRRFSRAAAIIGNRDRLKHWPPQ